MAGPPGLGGGPGAAMRAKYKDPKQRQAILDDLVKSAIWYKKLGFQMLTTRISQASGSDIDFCLAMADAMKSSLGRDYPLEFYIDGIEAGIPVQQNLALARALEGKIDILAVHYGIQDHQHPTGFASTRLRPSPCVDLAAALTQDIHSRGGKLLVGVSAGLHDPDYCENLLRTEQADMIIMARTWICEPEYLQKLEEGRGEDVVPCVRCNKCHVPNGSDSFRSFCTVNPTLGMEEKIDRMKVPVTGKKKVAVVGGGPGGMYAALTAAKRGHDVTLYEKEGKLGGLLGLQPLVLVVHFQIKQPVGCHGHVEGRSVRIGQSGQISACIFDIFPVSIDQCVYAVPVGLTLDRLEVPFCRRTHTASDFKSTIAIQLILKIIDRVASGYRQIERFSCVLGEFLQGRDRLFPDLRHFRCRYNGIDRKPLRFKREGDSVPRQVSCFDSHILNHVAFFLFFGLPDLFSSFGLPGF